MKTKHHHFNNHITSKQDLNKFALEVFNSIINDKHGFFTISIDDGDGDVWKFEIDVSCSRVKNIQQIKEN